MRWQRARTHTNTHTHKARTNCELCCCARIEPPVPAATSGGHHSAARSGRHFKLHSIRLVCIVFKGNVCGRAEGDCGAPGHTRGPVSRNSVALAKQLLRERSRRRRRCCRRRCQLEHELRACVLLVCVCVKLHARALSSSSDPKGQSNSIRMQHKCVLQRVMN